MNGQKVEMTAWNHRNPALHHRFDRYRQTQRGS